MKSWKYRLMTPYQRNQIGANVLLRARIYLKSVPFNSTEALALLWNTWHTDGNFYKKGNFLNKQFEWECKIRSIPRRVRYRLGLIWGALIGSASVGYRDDC